MAKLIIEFSGTFFLVLTIALAGAHPLGPIAIGAMLMAMVYMGGHVSGAHYNPAVTMAVVLRRKLDRPDAVPYVIAQMVGAFAAAGAAELLTGETFGAGFGNTPVWKAIAAESVFTFALVSVVLHTATHRRNAGNFFYGVAIGFTVAASAVAIGGISGAALNPAVGIAPALYAMIRGAAVPGAVFVVYIVGPLAGAGLAALAFNASKGNEAD